MQCIYLIIIVITMTVSYKRIYFLLLLLTFTIIVEGAKRTTYNILYVQSYTERDTWSKESTEGLIKGFKENGISVNVTTEFLNSRLWDSEGEEKLMREILRRADERNTAMIVVSNDEALYTLLTCGDPLVSKIPVVYFGVEFPNKEVMSKFDNLTGTTSPHAYDVLLETAKHVFPNRTNTVMVTEETVLGRWGAEVFRNYWTGFSENNADYKLKLFNVTYDPLTEILSEIQISSISGQSIMVIPYWGLYMTSIAKVSKAPTFTLSGSSLLNGVFCSVSPDMFEDARHAAKLGSRILNGESPASIPVTESNYQLTFDYQQLKFFKVGKERLPKNSVVINEPYMEKYGAQIFLFYALVVGLLVLLVVRLVMANRRESRKRMHAQTKLLIQSRLVSQRNEFDNIFHSIRDAVITYDTDFRIHFINRSTFRMLNMDEADISSRPYEGQMAGSILALYNNGEDILMSLLKKVNMAGTSMDVPENSFIQDVRSKNYFPVSGEIQPLYAQGKQSGIVFTFRNISDVAMQKRFFNLAIEESSIFPWQFNQLTGVFTFPAGYMSHMGFEGTTLPRSEMDKYIHPEDWQHTISQFDSVLDGQQSTARITFRQRNHSGNYEWWEFRISAIAGLTVDSPYNILGVSQSVQRYKVTEEELIAARDRALQADKLKSAFLANMSHEIRTPLNAIVGFSDLLKDYRMFSEEEIEQFIATINKNCELLLALISDILDLSRVESGTMDFQFSSYYLPIVFQEIYDSQRLNMPMGVELIKEIPQNSERTIITDSVRLKQVINNLINNAVKFTSKGSITFGYTEDESDFTTFFVQDTGTGISKEDLNRIFERFYKVDSFTQGAGLGLSISQTIVSRLRGTITVTSELGKGTHFIVRVPNTVE